MVKRNLQTAKFKGFVTGWFVGAFLITLQL